MSTHRLCWFIAPLLGLFASSAPLGCQGASTRQVEPRSKPKPDLAPSAPAPAPAPPTPLLLDRFTAKLPPGPSLYAHLHTSEGVISCELFAELAPATVTNFVGLATGQLDWVDPTTRQRVTATPYYNGVGFSRLMPDFLIQAGDRQGDGRGGPGYTIPDEFDETLRHDRPGRLSMANAGPDTGGAQFFITASKAPHLDDRHALFGQCEPLELITAISRRPTDAHDAPLSPVTIERVELARAPF